MVYRTNRLVVIGNGPSLRGFDFAHLSGVSTLGMNAAYRHWERIDWYPDIYVCLDDQLTLTHKDSIHSMIRNRKCRIFFLLADILKWYPELASYKNVYFLHSFYRTSWSKISENHNIPFFDSPFFNRQPEDPITSGSFSVRFGAFLGFETIGLIGIDCHYKNIIPEAISHGDIKLEIAFTPERNPNYFFDDYQQKGDRYNIPNPNSNIHLSSFENVRDVLTSSGVTVYNLNTNSALYEKHIFPYMSVKEFVAEPSLSAIFVPCMRFEKERIIDNFALWDSPGSTPYLYTPEEPRINLCFALNDEPDLQFESAIRRAFDHTIHVKKAFAEIFFYYSGLHGDADSYTKDLRNDPGDLGYTSGPNHQFFDIITKFTQGMSYILLMESDCRPIRSGWLKKAEEIVLHGDGFWICGSLYRGVGAPRHYAHINGNAIYAVGKPGFCWFMEEVYFPFFKKRLETNKYLPYDIVIEEIFRDVHLLQADKETLSLWKKCASRFRYTEFIQNVSFWYDAFMPEDDLLTLRARYPETYILHGKQFFTKEKPSDQLFLESGHRETDLTFKEVSFSENVQVESELSWIFHNKGVKDQNAAFVAFIFYNLGYKKVEARLQLCSPTPCRVLVRLMRHGDSPFEEIQKVISVGPGYLPIHLEKKFIHDHNCFRVQLQVLTDGRNSISIRDLNVGSLASIDFISNFKEFTYSKYKHFDILPSLGCYAGHSPDKADLKMYQDNLTYAFIRAMLPKGSLILEVGGGDSRLARELSEDYEYWCLDKLEGKGNGPTTINLPESVKLVRDYLGNFSTELPEGMFDLVFSVSVIEHVPHSEIIFKDIIKDIHRLLKPKGLSMHCIDVVLKPESNQLNPILYYLFSHLKTVNTFVPFYKIRVDPDLYVMTKEAYEFRWERITGASYEEFGLPFSYNILWQKHDQDIASDSNSTYCDLFREEYEMLNSWPLHICWNELPRISMVVPSLNQAQYIEVALDSILSQGYPNLELYVMDGGSKDGSVDIIKRYAHHLSGWQSQPDGGHYHAIREGLSKTTGDIMGWLNSDDILHADSLFKIAHTFKVFPHILWLTGRPTIYNKAGDIHRIIDPLPVWTPTTMADPAVRIFLQQESTFWRRSLWLKAGGLRTDLSLAGDYALWMSFFRYARIYVVDMLLGGYRQHDTNRAVMMREAYLAEKQKVNNEYSDFLAAAAIDPIFNQAAPTLNKALLCSEAW